MEKDNLNKENSAPISLPYSLKGKNVTIYRGGPESKTGRLIDVQSDYIALGTENGVIYYQAEHIKSISEDPIFNSMQSNLIQEDNIEYYQGKNFVGIMNNLKSKLVQVNQGGPESKKGILLDVKSDYAVVSTNDDGIVYYNIHHIKSIMTPQNNNSQIGDEVTNLVRQEYIGAPEFNQLFRQMTHGWVSINRHGPEALEGILVENTDGYFTLINNKELYRIHPFHVRSISFGPKGFLKKLNNKEDDNAKNSNEKEEKNDKENKSDKEDKNNAVDTDNSQMEKEKNSNKTNKNEEVEVDSSGEENQLLQINDLVETLNIPSVAGLFIKQVVLKGMAKALKLF
ncbi:spore coat protein [Heyndrickxia oleronia]|uniref:spore coat protein n=1 Tax=Heyndrickxia oleronia TaxID=38875 RepID=UPI00375260F6